MELTAEMSGIFSKETTFLIDGFLQGMRNADRRAVRLPLRWGIARTIAFGRHTLNVAADAAQSAAALRQLEGTPADWKAIQRSLDAASVAVTRAIASIVEGDPESGKPIASEALAVPIGLMMSRTSPEVGSELMRRRVGTAADFLLSATPLLRELSEGAARLRRETASTAKNLGELEKAAFAEVWAKGWYFATKRRPGKNPKQNPFSLCVRLAWQDAFGVEGGSFESAIKTAIGKLGAKPERPYWLHKAYSN